MSIPKALTVAGSDSGGGAGIQADIKTFQELGVFGMSAITAITVQNTLGVQGVYPLPAAAAAEQMNAVGTDLGVDAVKTGMLFSADIIEAVAGRIAAFGWRNVVVDPVMVAKGGARLLQQDAVDALKNKLLPLAAVVTPNIPEAEVLAGMAIRSMEERCEAAYRIAAYGPAMVVIKGGHDESSDKALAKGNPVNEAVRTAREFIQAAIENSLGIGGGSGPTNHWAYRSQKEGANSVRTWKAIPYAEPPVGERRFRKPLPARPWGGVRSGDMTVPLAPQRVNPTGGAFRLKRDQIPQSEDCLYVNVWAPDEPAPQPLPVMVWIHGGAFVTGGGGLPIYDGSELARRGGLIVVSLSYRLGPLGFTHFSPFSGESEDSYVSNAGLLDQIEALRWVKHNIAAFGGDPQQVTVFGESAGSMSIAALLAMPAAQGLFTRAIMQSGASQAISDSHGRLLTKGLLDILGIPEDQLERLQEVPADEILRAADELKQAAGASAVMLFQPVVDGKLLPVTPLEAVASGSAAGIEIII
ncbi:hypothetical protein BGX30_007142, partial [Mortierella sp. GBA39]